MKDLFIMAENTDYILDKMTQTWSFSPYQSKLLFFKMVSVNNHISSLQVALQPNAAFTIPQYH
jgi:hypothetical protein